MEEKLYTNAEIAHELDKNPTTVREKGHQLFGKDCLCWTLGETECIARAVLQQEAENKKRLALLSAVIASLKEE